MYVYKKTSNSNFQKLDNNYKCNRLLKTEKCQRDQKTIVALETLQQSSVIELLLKTVGTDTRKMANFLMFAEQHKNTTGVKSTFNELSAWKASRSYK